MSSVAWTWRTNTYAMWHMSSLSWRIASYMRKMKEFFCSLHHFLVYIFTGSIEPLETFLTNFGAMHLYIFYSIPFIFQTALYFAKFNAYFGPATYFWPNLLHILIATYFAEAGLNSASFGSHDSRSEVRDGVQPFMGSPILTVSPS